MLLTFDFNDRKIFDFLAKDAGRLVDPHPEMVRLARLQVCDGSSSIAELDSGYGFPIPAVVANFEDAFGSLRDGR